MKVSIRPLGEEDTELVVSWRRRPDVHDQLLADVPPSLESHARWLEDYRRRVDRQEFIIVADDQPVGTVGLSHIDRFHRRAEYGVLIGVEEARRLGVAARASELVFAHAFEGLALARLTLHVFPENLAAVRLYERLGFKREGLLRAHIFKGGRFRDLMAMGLLADERTAGIK